MAEEQRFVLHDGSDSNETDRLHEFLSGIDWEGDEGGVYLYLHVNVGDTIVRVGDEIRIERRTSEANEGGDPTTTELLKPRGNGGVVSPDIVYMSLLLVGGISVSEEEADTWTQEQRDQVYDWAVRVHLKASDNDDVLVPPRPEFLPVRK